MTDELIIPEENLLTKIDFTLTEFKGKHKGFDISCYNTGRYVISGKWHGNTILVESPYIFREGNKELMEKAFIKALSVIVDLLDIGATGK